MDLHLAVYIWLLDKVFFFQNFGGFILIMPMENENIESPT